MAGIKSILVHVDATPQSVTRLQITYQLAARHGARITALFGATPDTERRSFAYSAAAALGEWRQRVAAATTEARDKLEPAVREGAREKRVDRERPGAHGFRRRQDLPAGTRRHADARVRRGGHGPAV